MADSRDSATEKTTDSTDIALPMDLPPEVVELARDNPQVRKAVLIIAEQYKGPIPAPKDLRGFEEVVPGSAKDLIEEFKLWGQTDRNALDKRLESEIELSRAETRLAFRGQSIAAVLVLVFGICGVIRIFMGDPVGGGILLGTTLLGKLAELFLGNQPETRGTQAKPESSKETTRDDPPRTA